MVLVPLPNNSQTMHWEATYNQAYRIVPYLKAPGERRWEGDQRLQQGQPVLAGLEQRVHVDVVERSGKVSRQPQTLPQRDRSRASGSSPCSKKQG